MHELTTHYKKNGRKYFALSLSLSVRKKATEISKINLSKKARNISLLLEVHGLV
jgi:hypothetical protein